MTEREAGWAIGLYEGEGSCYTNRHQMFLNVKSTDLDVLERFQNIVGVGTIYKDKPRPENPHYKPIYRWQVHNKANVAHMIMFLKNEVSPRRREQFKAAVNKRRRYLNERKTSTTTR